MIKPYAKMTTVTHTRKEDTKTVYEEVHRETIEISKLAYNKLIDSAPAHRRAGSSVTHTKGEIGKGTRVVRILTVSPGREWKIERLFDFD